MSSDAASYSSSRILFADDVDGLLGIEECDGDGEIRSGSPSPQRLPTQRPADTALCPRCRLIDFEYIGFHNSAQYGGNNYSVQRDFASLLATSSVCAFCWEIVSIAFKWLDRNGEEENRLDLGRSRVDIALETDWHLVTTVEVDSDKSKAHSDRLKVAWSIPQAQSHAEPKTENLTFFLQKSTNFFDGFPAPEKHGKCGSLGSCEPSPYTARYRPTTANMDLFKTWKNLCHSYHGVKCSQIFKGTPKILPRLIDVDRRCLTMAQEDQSWVCVSYVWGRTNATRLLRSNIHAFSAPGSLTPDILPAIAEDALQVTRGLGEKFLWIDSLCIVQDDMDDKGCYIAQMDSIYALATVVITAASCVNANSHLPGVRTGSRHEEQEPFAIRKVPLVQSLDPVRGVKADLRTGRAGSYLGDTIWDTRAWTLQERFLASRCLVFTNEQVYWECEEAFWCEDSFCDFPHISPDPHRSSLCGGELNLTWNSDVPTFDHFYRTVLEEYSRRSLTYDSDGLNAFSGIIRAFERSAGQPFFWGMPTAFLESTLAWGSRNYSLRRRNGNELSIHEARKANWFPSWSWAGWTSSGNGKLDNQKLNTEPLGLEFHCFDAAITIKKLGQAMQCNSETDLLAEGSDIPGRESRPHTISREDLAEHLPINHSLLLCFWTASVALTFSKTSTFNEPAAPLVSINDTLSATEPRLQLHQGNKRINASWFQCPNFIIELNQQERPTVNVEIIAIAQNRGDWDGHHIDNGAIGVMVITWERGVAFRGGFAWIAIRDWTALKDRTWKLITLA
ncbi:MAG: hypothetical protein Q9160_008017 [Pyrenula sp. 1 TL-2023]